MIVPFMSFQTLFNKIPYDFLKFNFSHFTPKARLFIVGKRKPKKFTLKGVMERGLKKKINKIAPIIFRTIIY